MNNDIISGKWKQLTGKAKETWGQLTDNDWTEVDGKRQKLSGKLQERYGYAKDRAEQEVDSFVKKYETEQPRV